MKIVILSHSVNNAVYLFEMVWKHEQKFIEQKKERRKKHAKKQTFRVDNVKQMQLFNHFLLNISNILEPRKKTSFRLGFARSLAHSCVALSSSSVRVFCFVICVSLPLSCVRLHKRVMAWLTNFLSMHFKNAHGIYNHFSVRSSSSYRLRFTLTKYVYNMRRNRNYVCLCCHKKIALYIDRMDFGSKWKLQVRVVVSFPLLLQNYGKGKKCFECCEYSARHSI